MISRTGSGYISFTDRIRIYYFTERTGSISLTDRIRIHYFTDRSRVDSFTDRIRIILKNRIRVGVFYRPMKWIQNTLDITRDFTHGFIIIFTFLFCLFVCLFVSLFPINVKTAEPGPNFLWDLEWRFMDDQN